MSTLSLMVREFLKLMNVQPEQQVTEAITDSITNSNIKSVGEFSKQMFENQVKRQQSENLNQGRTIEDMMLQLYRSQQQREREQQERQQEQQAPQKPQQQPEEKEEQAKSAEERLTKVKRKIQYD